MARAPGHGLLDMQQHPGSDVHSSALGEGLCWVCWLPCGATSIAVWAPQGEWRPPTPLTQAHLPCQSPSLPRRGWLALPQGSERSSRLPTFLRGCSLWHGWFRGQCSHYRYRVQQFVSLDEPLCGEAGASPSPYTVVEAVNVQKAHCSAPTSSLYPSPAWALVDSGAVQEPQRKPHPQRAAFAGPAARATKTGVWCSSVIHELAASPLSLSFFSSRPPHAGAAPPASLCAGGLACLHRPQAQRSSMNRGKGGGAAPGATGWEPVSSSGRWA